MPKSATDADFDKWVQYNESASGWWANYPKYAVSLLKAWFGDAATKENGWMYDCLPHLTGDHSHQTTVSDSATVRSRVIS